MIFSAVTILMLLLLAFVWSNRGFYSGLINMVCVIAAGAIAFAFWEPIGHALVNAAPARGFLSALQGVAWGLALALPFAVSLAILRLVLDQVLSRNINVSTPVNYAGAGICGLISALITTGIFALTVSNFRFVPGPVKIEPVQQSTNGSITRQEKLWVPVDAIVAGLYGHLSERTLASDTSLARWHPDFHEAGYANRQSFEGKARNTLKATDFQVMGTFKIGGGTTRLPDLLKDMLNPAAQTIETVDGKPYDPASSIEGVVVQFNASAGESSGKVVLGNAQVRMVVENDAGDRRTIYPISVSSQADGDQPLFGRWRFDGRNVFVSSVGGGATALMMFEFVVEPGFKPLALYVRGIRSPLEGVRTLATFPTAIQRDLVIANLGQRMQSGDFTGAPSTGPTTIQLDVSTAAAVANGDNSSLPEGVRVGNAIGFIIQLGMQGSAEIKDNKFVRGEQTFEQRQITQMQGVDRKLRIMSFEVDSDVQLVHVEVGNPTLAFSFLNSRVQSAPRTDAATLIDTNGNRYVPVGLVYGDATVQKVRYTPDAPMSTLNEIDQYGTMSRSRPEAKMTLVFRVSKGVDIKYFAIGNRALAEFTPPLPTR